MSRRKTVNPRRLSYEKAEKVLHEAWAHPWRYKFERSGNIFVEKGKGAKDRNIPVHYKLKRILGDYLEEKKRQGLSVCLELF